MRHFLKLTAQSFRDLFSIDSPDGKTARELVEYFQIDELKNPRRIREKTIIAHVVTPELEEQISVSPKENGFSVDLYIKGDRSPPTMTIQFRRASLTRYERAGYSFNLINGNRDLRLPTTTFIPAFRAIAVIASEIHNPASPLPYQSLSR